MALWLKASPWVPNILMVSVGVAFWLKGSPWVPVQSHFLVIGPTGNSSNEATQEEMGRRLLGTLSITSPIQPI